MRNKTRPTRDFITLREGSSTPPPAGERTTLQVTQPGCEVRRQPETGWNPQSYITWGLTEILHHELDWRVAEELTGETKPEMRDKPPNPVRVMPPTASLAEIGEIAATLTTALTGQIRKILTERNWQIDLEKSFRRHTNPEALGTRWKDQCEGRDDDDEGKGLTTPTLHHRTGLIAKDQVGVKRHGIRFHTGRGFGPSWARLGGDGHMLEHEEKQGNGEGMELGVGLALTLGSKLRSARPNWIVTERPLAGLARAFDAQLKRYGAIHAGVMEPVASPGPWCGSCPWSNPDTAGNRLCAVRMCDFGKSPADWGNRNLPRIKAKPMRKIRGQKENHETNGETGAEEEGDGFGNREGAHLGSGVRWHQPERTFRRRNGRNHRRTS